MRSGLVALSVIMAGLSAPALAQDADRFQMERTPEGYVRLDKRTGEMSVCAQQGTQLVCKLAVDDRQVYDSAIDRLQASVDSLEGRVAALESRPKSNLPTETEFDQTMNYMQRFFRGFMGIVKEFEQETRQPDQPGGERT